MKKMLSLVLSTVVLLGLLAGCGADAPKQTDGNGSVSSTSGTAATPTNPFPFKGTDQLGGNIMTFMEAQGYPAYYGGCYLDPESNVVVILATDIQQAQISLEGTLKNWVDEAYRFAETAVSYQQLLDVYNQVQDSMDTWNAMDVPIASVNIDVMNSRVSVGVVGLNAGSTKAIRELVKDPLLYLYDSDGISLD